MCPTLDHRLGSRPADTGGFRFADRVFHGLVPIREARLQVSFRPRATDIPRPGTHRLGHERTAPERRHRYVRPPHDLSCAETVSAKTGPDRQTGLRVAARLVTKA